MRCMGFAKYWGKLKKADPSEPFTTFRVERKDADRGRDWRVGEQVQVVLHSRTPQRQVLGFAEITGKEAHYVDEITPEDAREDGFKDCFEMVEWFAKTHGAVKLVAKPLNKLTLKWIQRV